MSYIIDNRRRNYFYNFNTPTPKHSSAKSAQMDPTKNKEKSCLSKVITEGLRIGQAAFACHSSSPLTTMVGPFDVGSSLMAAVTLTERPGGELLVRAGIVTGSHRLYSIQTHQLRILLSRGVILGQKLPKSSPLKVSINIHNGEIRLSLPPCSLAASVVGSSSVLRRISLLHKLIHETIFQSKLALERLFKKVPKDREGILQAQIGEEELYRLRQMLNIFKKANDGAQVMTEKTIREYKMRETQSIRKMLAQRAPTSQELLHSLTPYEINQKGYQIKTEEECQLNPYQSDTLRRLIIPSRKMYQQAHTSSLLSHIYINKPDQIKIVQNLAAGGFSTIFLADVEFCFVDPNQYNQKMFDPTQIKWQRNLMVFKKELPTSKKVKRNKHERAIIDKLKNSTSTLLNRYYCAVNGGAVYQQDIIMDYVPFPTLKEYMLLSQHSISLQTKVLLLIGILQGIRSLARCDVVHLDLKPNNIMLNPNLQIKLLDFGESYHPQVKSKPGFTMPYSCPQVHSGQEPTFKSDVYSFGVILFEMLYRRHPFLLHFDANLDKYKTEEYLEHWLYTPEQALYLGEQRIYCSLNDLASKCLQRDASKRPELQAIGMFLHECLRLLE